MPDSPVSAISFEKYLALLRDAAPDTVDLYACDSAGCLLAADDDNSFPTPADKALIDCGLLSGMRSTPGEAVRISDASNMFVIPVCNAQDEPFAYLAAAVNDGSESGVKYYHDLLNHTLPAVASCIEREFRLTAELDAMANELAERYEELNLVYETTDDVTEFGSEGHTLTNLIEKYIEHLDVDMIALAFPRQERIYSAASDNAPIPDAYGIINTLLHGYAVRAGNDGKFLLINDLTDPVRDEYNLHAPCKLMACPILNIRGALNGLLVCMNHVHHRDFYNSDKNLLQVISKKVAKIVESNYDVLTGLINQHAFENIIQDAINRSHSKGLFHCLLNVDLDKLKVINESLGRDAGDYLIQHVADLTQQKLRTADSVSYLGEGRYGVLLEQCSLEQGMLIAESLRKQIDETVFMWNSKPVELTISIGVALIEPHTHDIGDILEAVEMARDAAKELGQNRIQLYRANDDDLIARKDHLHWVTRIQQALRHDEFSVYCQAICPVAPASNSYHFEILLRMVDSDGSIISPGKFIPPAEQFNLMPIIDRWVISRTFAILASSGFAQLSGEGIVSINLSGQSLTDPELTVHILDNMKRYGIAPECICFEITETTAIRDIVSAQTTFTQLKSIGCKLSLDDFGTGLSSFSYLKEMPVDYLKIDGSFVRSIIEDGVSLAMVTSINHVGHVMGLQTIAEYVESDELAVRLKQIGIDHLQGYAIAKPCDLHEYLSVLRASASATA